LERFLEDVQAAEPDAPAPAGRHGGYLTLVRALGARTAELHAALSRAEGDAAFEPVRIDATDISAWARRAHGEAVAVLDRLERNHAAWPMPTRAEAAQVVGARAVILARIDARADTGDAGHRIRIHGDYHLGQVLVVQNDFVIADFEGEPARTLAERREKQSPMKDVAGMLRSFDYALHAALRRLEGDGSELRATRIQRGVEWLAATQAAFIDSYDRAAAAAGLPGAQAQRNGLLDLFLFEKVMYELKYEMENRPDWVGIPLRGLIDLLHAQA
ncbi:MAG: alpha-amylase, partial [Casimicrobiaceae bacterium]